MGKETVAINIITIFLVLIITTISCGSNDTDKSDEKGMRIDLKEMYSEWNKCKNKEVSPGYRVNWKIKITSISSFGGVYGKGYIFGDKFYTLHLAFDPESELYKSVRSKIAMGSIILANGTYEGVTEKGEIIIEVEHIDIINKGWLRTLLPFW